MKKRKIIFYSFVVSMACSSVFAAQLTDNIEMSALVEVEANFVSNVGYGPTDESDIVLATVELGFDAQINDQVGAHVLLLYEDDDTPFDIDEGVISVQLNDAISLNAGKMYVPFGSFDTSLVSDPLTLELGETNETVIQLGFGNDMVEGSVYIFNGDSIKSGDDDEINGVGVNLGGSVAGVDWGVSYISSLADSDTLQSDPDLDGDDDPSTATAPGLAAGTVKDDVAGIGVIANWSSGAINVIAEHIQALDSFAANDLGGAVSQDSEPSASSIEVAYSDENGVSYALGYQVTDEALFAGLPEDKVLVAVGMELKGGAALAIEYSQMNDYDLPTGSGEDSSQLLFQLAAEY